jgi:hypothetical protein
MANFVSSTIIAADFSSPFQVTPKNNFFSAFSAFSAQKPGFLQQNLRG